MKSKIWFMIIDRGEDKVTRIHLYKNISIDLMNDYLNGEGNNRIYVGVYDFDTLYKALADIKENVKDYCRLIVRENVLENYVYSTIYGASYKDIQDYFNRILFISYPTKV